MLKQRPRTRWFIAGARNHLQANRSLGFCFEICYDAIADLIGGVPPQSD